MLPPCIDLGVDWWSRGDYFLIISRVCSLSQNIHVDRQAVAVDKAQAAAHRRAQRRAGVGSLLNLAN
jgi:hypothetical protein